MVVRVWEEEAVERDIDCKAQCVSGLPERTDLKNLTQMVNKA